MSDLTIANTGQSNWNDATIFGDLHSEECQSLLQQNFNVICGRSKKQAADSWRAIDWTLHDLIENILSKHEVSFNKNGNAIVFAETAKSGEVVEIGNTDEVYELCGRKAQDIKNITFAGFDIDDGSELDSATKKVEKLGFFALIYTTHSHARVQTKIKIAELAGIWSEKNVLEYAASKGFKDAQIVEFENPEEYAKPSAIISHEPLQKFRILFPLNVPYQLDVANPREHSRLSEEYRARMSAFAQNVLNVDPDETGFDINRLFYTPRHPQSIKDWFIGIYAGPALTIDDMPLPDDYRPRQRLGSRSNADRSFTATHVRPILSDGFDLIDWRRDWGAYFLVREFFDILQWDIGSDYAARQEARILCPNDHSHSSPDDVMGCWIKDGTGTTKFAIHCHHNACREMGTLEQLVALEHVVALSDEYETLSELLCDRTLYSCYLNDHDGQWPAHHLYLRWDPQEPQTNVSDAVEMEVAQ